MHFSMCVYIYIYIHLNVCIYIDVRHPLCSLAPFCNQYVFQYIYACDAVRGCLIAGGVVSHDGGLACRKDILQSQLATQ